MFFQSIDTKLLFLINHGTANRFFDIAMPFLSSQGYLLVLPFLLFLFIVGNVRKNEQNKTYLSIALWTFLLSCCAVFLAEAVEYQLKLAIARVRPCRAIEEIRLIVACPKSFSMPSGHAISSFAFATPLYYMSRGFIPVIVRSLPLILAALIAFSRIYLGVHYPSDVLAGALLGALISLLLILLYEGMERTGLKQGKNHNRS